MKIERKIFLGILALGTIFGLEPLAWREFNTHFLSKSEKIVSKSQFEKLVSQERANIAPGNKDTLEFRFVGFDKASSIKLSEGKYEVVLGGYFLKENALKHELYHVLDGHHKYSSGDTLSSRERFLENLKYHFWAEPQASIYAATGIKL